jgi:hypothetical protein
VVARIENSHSQSMQGPARNAFKESPHSRTGSVALRWVAHDQYICIFYLKRTSFGYPEEYDHSVLSQPVSHCTRKLFCIPKSRVVND